VFASELIAMIEAGAGLVVGTVGEDGAPRGIRAWAAWVVDHDEQRIRVVLTGDDPTVVARLEGCNVAVTAGNVRTLQSVQLKGRVSGVEQPTAADMEITERHIAWFFQAVHDTDGNPIELLQVMRPSTHLVLEMVVDEQYDQTPGPTAGHALQTRRT
jgi:hypothetical protein